MIINDLQEKVTATLTENASAILTATGVVGTVGTAILTGRQSFKAAAVIQEAKFNAAQEADLLDVESEFGRKNEILAVWPLFIPPVALGGGTIAAIIFANRISAKKAAALAAAYGISEQYLEEYKAKALEKLGINKEQKVRDEIAQDRVNENPPDNQVIILASGDVLCYDQMTGRYFQSTVENIKKAENRVNQELFNYQSCSLSLFYEEVGLQPTGYSDEVGWNQIEQGNLEVQFSTVMSPRDEPCISIDFNHPPKPDYTKLI